jgi:transmembrane sensor
MNSVILEEARLWLNKEQEGLDLKACEEFQLWIEKSSKHKEVFEEEKNFRKTIKQLSKDVLEELSFHNQKEIRRDNIFKKSVKPSLYAATFLIVFFVSYFTYTLYIPSFEKLYVTENKINKNIKLLDNSIITLDKNSKIKVSYYKEKREVRLLEGKVLFSVASNKNRPFLIQIDNTVVEVVGTKFEIEKLKNSVNISVIEGVVNVKHVLDNSHTQIVAVLQKADHLEVNSFGKINKMQKVNEKMIAAWEKDKLYFKQTKLREVVKEFTKYLDFNVIIENKQLELLPVTGEFSITDFENLMKSLSIIHPIDTQKINNTYFIRKKL